MNSAHRREGRMGGLMALLMSLTLLSASSAFATANYQPPIIGSVFEMTETYAADFTIEGGTASGDIAINATTRYEVVRKETYTQQCPDLNGSVYDCYYIEYTGTANLIADPISVNYPPINLSTAKARIRNAKFDGKLWLRESDLATVAKKREIQGDAELDPFGFGYLPNPIANATANQFEEYILPLEDYAWPLTVGAPARRQQPSICAYGDYAASIDFVIQDTFQGDFAEIIDINFNITVPRTETKNIGGTNYTVYVVDEASPDFGASQLYHYSPDLRWIVRQEITQLTLFGLANIKTAVLDVTSANVPQPPTETPTPTPTGATATPTPTPTMPMETPTPSPTTGNNTPTPTATMSMDNNAPNINVAGYLSSFINTSGGNLTMLAWVTDPDGDAIDSLELYVGGASTGTMVPQIDPGVFQLNLGALPGPLPPTSLTLELMAKDERGASSTLWPYLPIADAAAPAPAPSYAQSKANRPMIWSTENMLRLIEEHGRHNGFFGESSLNRNASASGPFIAAGGYFNTHLIANEAGNVTFGVVPLASPGASITKVELYYAGAPTGAELINGATPLGPGIWGLAFPVDANALDGSFDILLEAVAFDSTGGQSTIWPHLTIVQ